MDRKRTLTDSPTGLGSPAEAKVFNPSIGKLDPKTVRCHFIGYPEKSKDFRFYCPDRHTKFVETRHAVFLEDKMIRGSMVPREIDLEKMRVYVPTPMIQEPFFSLHVGTAPKVPEIVTAVPFFGCCCANYSRYYGVNTCRNSTHTNSERRFGTCHPGTA